MDNQPFDYDALLVVSFGGPEGRDDVIPFLRNVLRGRDVPEKRMLEVAEHYYHFDGVSPINEQNRLLIDALKARMSDHSINLPVYWGNRNWHPLLEDTLQKMKADGVKRALAFFTSAFSCYSGCRQYRENIEQACLAAGKGAPVVDKLRMFFNHPFFVEACAARINEACEKLDLNNGRTTVLFTAHSIPVSMAEGCRYVQQLAESARLVFEHCQLNKVPQLDSWKLVYQSRSGPPHQPWLEPDICDYLDESGSRFDNVVVMPIGFLSDHMEVLFDLDTEAAAKCEQLGIKMVRAGTVGTHPRFIDMICDLISERSKGLPKKAIGDFPANHDVCPENCCLRTT